MRFQNIDRLVRYFTCENICSMCFSLIVCHGSHWKRGWRDALAGHARSNDELYDMLPNMIQDGIEEKETK